MGEVRRRSYDPPVMRLVTVVATLAALALASSAAGQERHPASLRVISARPCGAAIPSSGEVLTITPNGDGVRDCAAVAFVLARPARVEFVVAQRKPRAGLVYLRRLRARTGITTVVWAPPPTIDARTYVTRLSLRDASGALTWRAGPVIRVRATRARFERESYAPGELATLLIDDRASTLQLEIVDAATEQVVAGSRRVRGSLARIRIGPWPPGVYVARLRAGDALIQAPLVVRAPASARPRVGVVLPTNTWQAYNFLDGDGDGTGDSWYASRRRESARLDRPFMGDGLPPYFHRYDLSFLRWLRTGDRRADFLSDADLDRVPDAATLARRYDLLVFPGHHEYVTAHEYELLTEYRDRGGNLIFLSADNLHWRVVRIGPVLRRKEQFRNVGGVGRRRVPRERSRWSSRLVRRPQRQVRAVAPRGDRPRDGLAVRLGRRRDRRGDPRFAARDLCRRGDPTPPRSRADGADDVLRDIARREGVRGGCLLASESNACDADVAGQPLDAALTSMSRRPVRLAVPLALAALLVSGVGSGGGATAPRIEPAPFCTLPPGATRLPASARRGLIGHLEQYPSLALASPAQRRAAEGVLAVVRREARAWRTLRAAQRAGFETKTARRRAGDTTAHYLHAEVLRERRSGPAFDPRRPKALIFAREPGRPAVLVGAMYSVQRAERGPSPGGPITRWHSHRVCSVGVKRGLRPRDDGTCPSGARAIQGSEMMHVWFTRDLRSAFAIRAPEPELCRDGLLSGPFCQNPGSRRGM